MTNLLRNSSALSVLQSLKATQKRLAIMQNQVSAGQCGSSASNKAAVVMSMPSNACVPSAGTDAMLTLGLSTAVIATAAVDSALITTNKQKPYIATAQTPGVYTANIQTDIMALHDSLRSIATSASFNCVSER